MQIVKLPRIVLAIGSIVSIAACSSTTAERGDVAGHQGAAGAQILVSVQEMPSTGIVRLQHEGSITGTGDSFRLEVEKGDSSSGRTSIKLHIAGVEQASLALPNERFPALDLGSLKSYAGPFQGATALNLEARYGPERDCFENDDARDRLGVAYRQGKVPSVYAISFPNCEQKTEEFPEGKFVVSSSPR